MSALAVIGATVVAWVVLAVLVDRGCRRLVLGHGLRRETERRNAFYRARGWNGEDVRGEQLVALGKLPLNTTDARGQDRRTRLITRCAVIIRSRVRRSLLGLATYGLVEANQRLTRILMNHYIEGARYDRTFFASRVRVQQRRAALPV